MTTQSDQDLQGLRSLCALIDERVTQAITYILTQGWIPIIIGGGHNLAYPLLKALSLHHTHPIQAVNLDPHADCRPLEGRHSGNGFSYAYTHGYLKHYQVLGLHLHKNAQANFDWLQQNQVQYYSYQDIWVTRRISLTHALEQIVHTVQEQHIACGLELDCDSITGMPSSAYTTTGVSCADAQHYVYRLAQCPQVAYLHLAEAAPSCHPAGLVAGEAHVAQVLSALICAFMAGKSDLYL